MAIQEKRVIPTEDKLSLFAAANQFYETAVIVDDIKTKPFTTMPRYYLFAHSIELSYKSYLLSSGLSIDELKKKYGHNLEKLFEKAEEYGFLGERDDSSNYRNTIKCLNKYYSSKEFEYLSLKHKTLPFIEDVKLAAKITLHMAHQEVSWV